MFKIDEDETQEEILRRDKEASYYIESVRVFEQAFGIDRLEKIVDDIQQKRKVSIYVPLRPNSYITEICGQSKHEPIHI